jgi:hypothetical protein
VVAADGMQRVLRGEAVDPSRSSLPGLCETVAGAHPNLRCRTVDLRPSAAGAGLRAWIEATSKLLIAEVRYGREPAVAYRGGERWEPMAEEAPQTDLERALAEIWRELLGGPPVRRKESFFERGGDSRSALLLAERSLEIDDAQAGNGSIASVLRHSEGRIDVPPSTREKQQSRMVP